MQSAQSSHHKFNDTQVNIGMGEDVITKEEFEFQTTGSIQKKLKLLQKLSGVTIIFSIYQLVYGGLSLYYFQSTFPTFSTIMGFASLLLSITVAFWSNKALKSERNGTMSARSIVDGSWENFNSILFLILSFRAVSSLVLIANTIMQSDIVSQHTAAYGATFSDAGYLSASRTLTNMALPLPFVELLLSLIFIKAAKTVFGYLKDPSNTASRLLNTSAVVLLSSSLGLIFSVLRTQYFSTHHSLLPAFQNWGFKGLLALGITMTVVSLLLWLVNYKRWRVPSLAVLLTITGIVITLALFTTYTYKQREDVYKFYDDSTDLTSWSSKMESTHRNDIEAYGCPSKYLPRGSCHKALLAQVWEAGSDVSDIRCLNIQCSGLLGGLYSKSFLEITNFSLVCIVSSILALLGGLYSWRFNAGSLGQRSTKGLRWLGLMGIFIILFFLALTTIKEPYIHQHDNLLPISHDQWFGGSPVKMDSDLAQRLTDLVVLQKSRYIIMRFDVNTNKVSLVEEGDYSKTYRDFVRALDPENAEIALVRFPEDEEQDSLLGVVWLPLSTPEDVKNAYVQNYAVDKNDPRSENLGFLVRTASSKDQLDQPLVMSQIINRSAFLFDQSTSTQNHANALTVLASNVRITPKLAPGDAMELFKMVSTQKYKYIVLDLDVDGQRASIEERGTWDQTYDDFVEHFKTGQPKAGLIYLEIEGQIKLVAVVLEDDFLAHKREELFANHGIPNFDHLQKIGILPYIAHDTKDLKLENVLAGITPDGLAKQQAALAVTTPGAMSLWNLNPFSKENDDLVKQQRDAWTAPIREQHNAWAAPFSSGNPTIAGLSNVPSSLEAMRDRIRTVLVGEVGFSLGSEIFKMVTMNKYKYLISKYSTQLEKPELVSQGERSASYNEFVDNINPNQAQVSLIYLGLEGSDKLVMIIYAPESSYNDPATVYELFELPVDPTRLELIGLRVFVARNMNDLKLDNVMSHLYGDHQKIMNLIGRSVDSDTEVHTSLNDRVLIGLGEAGELLQTVITRKNKYVVLKYNPLTEKAVLTHTGDWDDDFGSFADSFHDHDEQIGLVYLELEDSTKPVLVVYSPKELKKNTTQVLHDFNLPANLDSLGANVYTASSRRDLNLKNILRGVYTDTSAVQKLIEQYQLLNLLNDDQIYLCDTCHCNVTNITEESSDGLFDSDYSDYTDLETDVFTTGANINLFGKMGLNLRRDIIKPIKSKQLKYIILKRDVPNKKVYVAKSGTWYATFDQFAREFEVNQPQVGFIYLEIEGIEKLAMAVYAPAALNMDYLQVLKDFDVTKNPTKLRKKGIETFVFREIKDLTLDNTMGAVFGAGTNAKIMLTQLVEEYAGGFEDKLMFALSPETLIEMQEANRMIMLSSLGLKVDKTNRKLITNHKNKYVILRKNPEKKDLELQSTGTWHATFDQFAREFDSTDQQVGFIYLELEDKEKLVMVLYSPRSYNQTFDTIFKSFGVARNAKKLEKKGISTYVAQDKVDLDLEKVLNSVFNATDNSHNVSPPPLSIFAASSSSPIPDDISDAINNKKYKYVIMQHNSKKNTNEVVTIGEWGKTYADLVKQVKKRQDQIIFAQLNLEAKQKLVLIVYSRKTPTGDVLSSFGFPEDMADLRNTGINVYAAHSKKDLDILKVLKGIYTVEAQPSLFFDNQVFNDDGSDYDESDDSALSPWESATTSNDFDKSLDANSLTMLYTEKDLPFGKDVLDAINNKKFKYIILKHDQASDKTFVEKFGKWDSTYKNFQKDFAKKDSQLGMIHITVEARDLLVLVVYTPKLTGTETLRQFNLPSDIADLQNLGFRPYIAHKKKDLDLLKVLQGVYNQDIFVQNNPSILVGESSTDSKSEGSIWLEAFKTITTKKYRYLIVNRDETDNKLSIGAKGDWNEPYDQFVQQFNGNDEQVGIVYVGIPGNERLVLVVFAPGKFGKAIPDVAKGFKLPKNPTKIQNLGFIPYLAHDLDDLQEARVIDSAYRENLALVDPVELEFLSSNNALWEQKETYPVPNTVGHDNWLRLFDLQGEIKRKISDITVDDSVVHTWNDFVGNHDNGYALIYAPKGSVRLSVQEVSKGLNVNYNDFLSQLKDTPLFALVFTQDLIQQTNIREPVLFEWNPKTVGLIEKTLSRDRLNPLKAKLNEPRYVYVTDAAEGTSFDNLVRALNQKNSEASSL